MVWQASFATCQTLRALEDTETFLPPSICFHLPDRLKVKSWDVLGGGYSEVRSAASTGGVLGLAAVQCDNEDMRKN